MRALHEESVDRCNSGNDSRATIQGILDQLADPPPSGAAAVDFSKVKGFGDLDPKTQAYLIYLSVTLQLQVSEPGLIDKLASDYRKSNPQVDCSKIKLNPGGK